MNAKVMEILTDDQKAKYKELLGEPFDVVQTPAWAVRAAASVVETK